MSGFAVIVVLIPVVGLVFLLANALLETSQMDAEKSTTYECGFTPLQGLTRLPLALAFYLVGLLFLVFDLELLLLIPLSVT
jgi:NADH:ubiquinone oxidoreductase subunit 3 (subunit A)